MKQSDLWQFEGEPDDQDIRDVRVFLLQKKAGSQFRGLATAMHEISELDSR